MTDHVEVLAAHRDLWDWRRRIAALYAAVREMAQPRLGWQLWRETRDELFQSHPMSPLDPAARTQFKGLPLFDYEPALRFAARLEPVRAPSEHQWSGGKDGIIHMQSFARTEGLERRLGAELTLYWIGGYGGGVFLPFKDATSATRPMAAGAICWIPSRAPISGRHRMAWWSSTSTSPITRPAPIPIAGSAPFRRRRTRFWPRCAPASGSRAELAALFSQ